MNTRAASSRSQPNIGFAACAIDVDAALAGRAQIFPLGTFRANDGRPADVGAWRVTPEIAARMAATAASRGTDTSFDYEHQTLRAVENGKPAPAAGWFHTIEIRDGAVWATGIEWTPAARQMIESREYRYTSPLFTYDKQSGNVLSLFNIALTNTPAIDGMDAVAASAIAALSSQPLPENSMDELLERLRWMLNLPVTATAEDISAQLDKLKEMIGETATAATGFSLTAHLHALGSELSTTRTALAAASAQPGTGQPDPAKFVPMDQFAAMQNRVAELSRQHEDRERNEQLDAGLADGRILPATKAYWETQPLAALSTYLKVAQPMPALAGMQSRGTPPAGSDVGTAALSADQTAIAKRMGLDPVKYAKALGLGG
ncbi:phage protease [Paraburkholderia sp.]|uniref:phage protease n=1 Tax=Paraburkholderia sp. TaxID=1926495 RepID=UPI003D6F1AA6